MSPRTILRILSVLFLLIGLFFFRNGDIDPAPRETWETYHGKLAELTITDGTKLGRRAVLTVSGDSTEPRFALSHIQKIPGLEQKLNALEPGSEIFADAVPRELAGWAAPEGEPLTLLVLKSGGKTLYDRDDQIPPWVQSIGMIIRIVGGLVSAIALLVFLLTFFWKARK